MEANTLPSIEIDGLSKIYQPPAIEIDGLSKTYRPQATAPVHAVVHVTLSVPAGQVVGVLGPNAAGKTTLLKLIAGMVRPTAGHVQVQGHDVVRERALALRQLGVALQGAAQRGIGLAAPAALGLPDGCRRAGTEGARHRAAARTRSLGTA